MRSAPLDRHRRIVERWTEDPPSASVEARPLNVRATANVCGNGEGMPPATDARQTQALLAP